MKNLAGVKDCDITIKEELYLAGIEAHNQEGRGEVPYTIVSKIGKWTLTRAWTYWVATVEYTEDGLPLKNAMELYFKPNPIDENVLLGESIRSGGAGGSPDGYTSQPVYNDELDKKLIDLGFRKEYSKILKKRYIPISCGDIANLCKSGKLDVERYVTCYHIDDQVSLNEFVKFIKEL